MNWVIFALLNAVFYAIAEIIGKYIADEKSDPMFVSFFANLYACIAAFVLSMFWRQSISSVPPVAMFGLLASGLVCAVGTVFYWKALKICDISDFVLITRAQLLFVFLGGIILFSESYGIIQIAGIACVIIGSILIYYRKKRIRLSYGLFLALISSLLFSIEVLIDKSIINYYNPMLYTALIYLVITIFLVLPSILNYRKQKILPSIQSHRLMVVSSSFYAVSAVMFYSSYTHGGLVGLTNTIGQLQIPLVVIYGILIFKEKDYLITKISATVLMIIGAILIG